MIEYTCMTAASNMWVLQYRLDARNRVTPIIHYYQP